MDVDHYKRDTCRLCEEPEPTLAAPVIATPVCDAYVGEERLHEKQESYPLDIYQCGSCGHFQLRDIVNPRILFSDYTYFSGRSAGLVRHFAEYAQKVIMGNHLDQNSFVVDIGSNDGAFLQFFKDQGMRVLGVDPAENIAAYANQQGIETLPSMFNETVAGDIRNKYGPATVVTANNVFAHTDDMIGMAKSVRKLLHENGVFVFEVSYFPDVIDKMLLGTIFHEHVCYHTIKPLVPFLERCGMELIDVERVSIQGGSIICTAQVSGGKRPVSNVIKELIQQEEERGLYERGALEDFIQKLQTLKNNVTSLVEEVCGDDKTFAGFGASRGGTLLTHHLDVGNLLQFIVDDSPDKQGTFSPGFHVPVLPSSALYQQMPDFTFILAWVHSKPIIRSHQKYLEQGGRFITFFPDLQIVDKENYQQFI